MRPRFTLIQEETALVILLRCLAMVPTALLLIALTPPARANRPSADTIAALPVSVILGVGAPLPFVEYEAENAVTHGRIVGPDRTFGTLAAEASGRRAVRITSSGRTSTGRSGNATADARERPAERRQAAFTRVPLESLAQHIEAISTAVD